MNYREKTITHCYCARCNKEIKAKRHPIKFHTLYGEGCGKNEMKISSNQDAFWDKGFYLCNRCAIELNLFLKNEYPTDYKELIELLMEENERLRNGYTEQLNTVYKIFDYAKCYAKLFSEQIENDVLMVGKKKTREQECIEFLFNSLIEKDENKETDGE